MISIPGVFIAGLVCYAVCQYIIHPVFLSPLSKIPNAHFTSPISPFWILWKRKRAIENRTLLEAHEKYGPVLRVGPSDISINCVDGGLRTVYAGGFEKHDWYPRIFQNYGILNMFSMAGSKQHSARKRLISNVYSKSYLQSSPDYQRLSHTIVVDRLLPLLEGHAVRKEPLNVLELNYTTAMDFITSYQFGISGGSNFLQDIKFRKHFLDLYYSRKSFTFWPQEMPKMRRFLHSIGIRVTPRFVDVANDQIEDWCLKLCSAAKAYTSSEMSTTPVVFQQLQQNLARTSEKGNLSDDRFVASEMLDHLAAGQETTGITLTYLEHELSKRPELQRRLREELLSLSTPVTYDPKKQDDGISELPSPKALDTLPLLHAIIMETLRRHAPIPGPQPRKTPNTPCTIAGYNNIPPGTRIAAAAYTLHRNAEVFPEPESWKPERWLDVTEEQKTEMGRWFWAFGSGGRMCIGSNFAMQEMKLLVAAIYTNYTTKIVDDDGIEQIDSYTAGPRGEKLILRFERVE